VLRSDLLDVEAFSGSVFAPRIVFTGVALGCRAVDFRGGMVSILESSHERVVRMQLRSAPRFLSSVILMVFDFDVHSLCKASCKLLLVQMKLSKRLVSVWKRCKLGLCITIIVLMLETFCGMMLLRTRLETHTTTLFNNKLLSFSGSFRRCDWSVLLYTDRMLHFDNCK
jgi:hypothetical protein